MLMVIVGTLLLIAKIADFGPFGGWSWWVVLAPFAIAVVWWQFADGSGLTRRRATASCTPGWRRCSEIDATPWHPCSRPDVHQYRTTAHVQRVNGYSLEERGSRMRPAPMVGNDTNV